MRIVKHPRDAAIENRIAQELQALVVLRAGAAVGQRRMCRAPACRNTWPNERSTQTDKIVRLGAAESPHLHGLFEVHATGTHCAT